MGIFSISLTTLKRWLKMRREGKDLSPGTSTGRRRRILATLEQIEERGSQLWLLPSYSPDYNPIEEAFSKVKNLL